MNFLSFVIALSLHQVLNAGNRLQRDDWLEYLDGFLARFLPGEELRLLAVLAVTGLVAHGILDYLGGWLFGLPMLLLAALFLVWSLGRDDYHTALERFEARGPGDPEGAREAVADLWAPLGETGGSESDVDPGELALQRLAYSAYERWFGPVFFFVVLGPVGALLYRCVCVLAARDEGAAARLLYWVHWIPARLLVLSFAVTGDFVAVVQHYSPGWFLERRPVPAMLCETADRACSGVEGARAISSIMYRSAGLWLLLISIGFLFL